MDIGEIDNTVTIRRECATKPVDLMVAPLAISSPEGCQTDMVAVPNPVIASVQIIDPGYDVTQDRDRRTPASCTRAGRWATGGARSSTPTTRTG